MTMSLIQACRSLVLSTWLLSFCFVHFFCLDFTVAEREEWYTAFINITYIDPITSMIRTEKTECGRYGEHSLKRDAKGVVILPSLSQDWQACDPGTLFPVPVQGSAWIALIASGNCTYKEKIRHAANQNASAIVIFNVGSSNANDTITMSYSGMGDVVAVMIPEPKGREVAALLERNVTVTMHITIGTRNLQKYVSRTSVVFVSISFIILMIISLAWLVFYYIQRFRYANARDRNLVGFSNTPDYNTCCRQGIHLISEGQLLVFYLSSLTHSLSLTLFFLLSLSLSPLLSHPFSLSHPFLSLSLLPLAPSSLSPLSPLSVFSLSLLSLFSLSSLTLSLSPLRGVWEMQLRRPSVSCRSGPSGRETGRRSQTLITVPCVSRVTSQTTWSGYYPADTFSIRTAWTPGCWTTGPVPCAR
uniref:PA domain-containing protein n=1 Tax=Oncorhynchus mykiss TaxID=8022 RepID=A0A8K9XI11_ONCMY